MRLQTQLIAAIAGLVAVMSISLFAISYVQTREALENELRVERELLVDAKSRAFLEAFTRLDRTARLATKFPPTSGTLGAGAAFDGAFDGTSYEQWEARLTQLFVAQLEESQGFLRQVRLLDAGGKELVSVISRDGRVEVVERGQLQEKGDRPYFREGILLARGRVHISPIELNQEYGAIEVPYVPTVRASIPVYLEGDEKPRGLIVFNAFAQSMLDEVVRSRSTDEDVIVIDQDGRYVAHPDPEKPFSHELGATTGYFDEVPGIRATLAVRDYFYRNDPAARQLRSWRKVFYDPDDTSRYYVVINRIEESALYDPIARILGRMAAAAGLVLIAAVLCAYLIAERISKPISALRAGALRLAAGEDPGAVAVGGAFEISQLSEAFSHMAREIAEKRANLELLVDERTKLLNVVIEQLPVGVVLADAPSGKLVLINTSGSNILGKGLQADVGSERYSDVYQVEYEDGRAYPSSELPLAVTLRTGKPAFKQDIFIRRPDGARTNLHVTSAPIHDADGRLVSVVAVFEDRTKELMLERRKDEFLSFATHQLKTPPTAIRWTTDMLLSGDVGRMTAQQREMVRDLGKIGVQMLETVNMFLNISRVELGSFRIAPEDASFETVVRGVLKDLESVIEAKRIKLVFDAAPTLGLVKLDLGLMRTLVQNLVTNAVKYTPVGGAVRVTLATDARGDQALEVADSGIGIPAASKPRIFERMFRAANVGTTEGTGFGLYLVKKIADASGLEVSFESDEGNGTTFRVRVPKAGMKAKEGSTTLA